MCVCVCVCVCVYKGDILHYSIVEYHSTLTDMAEILFTRNLMVSMVRNTYRAYTQKVTSILTTAVVVNTGTTTYSIHTHTQDCTETPGAHNEITTNEHTHVQSELYRQWKPDSNWW